MFKNSKFILLSALLVITTVVCGYFVIQRYQHKIPIIKKWTATSPYDGLKPEANNPNGIYYKNRVLVLMYHNISPTPEDSTTLSVANFEKQLELMQANNFHWISMSQYRDFILHGASVPDNAVLLTFDDGYESFYKYAYPLLQKYQAPASSFLIVNTLDNPKHIGMKKLTWEQVQIMHENGFDFFSHTYDSHEYAKSNASGSKKNSMLAGPMYLKDKNRKETEAEYELRITNDLKQANDMLQQKLGVQNYVLAFPYGLFSKPLLNISKELGIDITFTVKMGINKPGQTNGFRVNAGGKSNNPDLQLSLMKHAEEKLDGVQYNEDYDTYITKSLLVLGVVFILWLGYGWRLLRKRKHNITHIN
ncbi:biofilm PGA synthesis lipoprotein PgaB [Paenibacillus turicensis]|uniref:Biofilm PGA synthesis lipoprotein PgaB n=1 Tax=Paenibacillus turicensis TaxID=160487 RepID=A0ABS4FS56_9BACL|nr:polysaccharide deacetylase family protein [Paenibacillus turicensis]MBP1905405.1 biofilm PGA synthesis lipoprotein PgaB [Paenibacillus turicensis]